MGSDEKKNREAPNADSLLRRLRSNIGKESENSESHTQNDENILKKKDKNEISADEPSSEDEKKITLEEFYGYSPIVRDRGSNVDHRGHFTKNRPVRKINVDENESADDVSVDDETEFNLMSIFGMEKEEPQSGDDNSEKSDEKNEIPYNDEAYGDEKEKNALRRDVKTEFTDESQTEKIFAAYKKKYLKSALNIACCLLFVLFTALIEYQSFLPFELPAFFNTSYYPKVSVLLELQIIVLIIALMPKNYADGLRQILHGSADENTIFAVTTTLTAVYLVCMTSVSGESDVNLLAFPAVLSAFLASISNFVSLKREINSFCIVSSKKEKLALYRKTRKEAENEIYEMSRYLPENNKFIAVAKSERVSDFYKNMNTVSAITDGIKFLIAAGILISLAFGIYLFVKRHNPSYSLLSAYAVLMTALPFSSYFLYSYPLYCLSRHARKRKSAVIGSQPLEQFSAPATVTFCDDDVFTENGIKLVSVKTYGKMPMDKLLRIAAAVLCPTGGSLGKVLESITESCDITDDMEYLNVYDDGIDAAVDGDRVLLGSYHFIVRNHLTIPYDEETDDDTDVFMYMSVGNEVVAKLRLAYTANPEFKKIMKNLFSSGLSVAVKTFDPNVDLSLLCRTLELDEKNPIKIIHTHDPLEVYEVKKTVNSTLVSVGGMKQLMETLHRCSRTRHVISICSVLAVISEIVAAVVMAVAMTMTDITQISSLYIMLYQLFWILPPLAISKFMS